MIQSFIKDKDGRVAVHCGNEITAKATNTPSEPGNRNAIGLVYCKDADAVEVVVKINGVEHSTIASFTAKAKAGNMSAVQVRVRAYADLPEPVEPVIEELL